jgi:putative DNA primase/helicase
MQDLISFALSHDFEIGQPILDGSVHRINRKGRSDKSGWYIAKQYQSTKGYPYTYATIGDWATGEKIQFKPSESLSREDHAAIRETQKRNIESARQERERISDESAVVAQEKWRTSKPLLGHPYLTRKKISGDFGCRMFGKAILVPTRNIDGEIRGLQEIFPDGNKMFQKGQSMSGYFHLIGDIESSELVFLVEGLATGASVYMATGNPVIVCFNATNISKVARSVRKKWKKTYIVCGDDDKYSKVNAGRKFATEASKILGTEPKFPVFQNDREGLVDFNDLHVVESLESVRLQIKPIEIKRPFVSLGHAGGSYFFFSTLSNSIVSTTRFQDSKMLSIAPLDYWLSLYGVETNGEIRPDWLSAKDALISEAYKIGIFDMSRVRGCGVWLDRGRTVVNTGRNLIVDGQKISSIQSEYIYVATKNTITVPTVRGSVSDMGPLVSALAALNFKNQSSWKLLGGWLAISRIAGALPIRPHVWITGGKGTGKSTVFENLITKMVKKSISAQGAGTTEAGLRQSIAADAIPVIVDEFELNGPHQTNVSSMIELMRQAWSYTESKIFKGSATGVAQEYSLAFCALVSSIRISLDNDADESRFAILELENHGSNDDEWQRLKGLLNNCTDDLADRLFARSLDMIQTIKQSYEIAKSEISGVATQREGQQYGMLIAGFNSLISDSVINPSEALRIFSELQIEDEDHRTDSEQLLDTLMSTKITIQDHKATRIDISIARAVQVPDFHDDLEKYGIRVENGELYVANSHTELKRLLSKTRWNKNWYKVLRRLPGARSTEDRPYFSGHRSRATIIKIK